MQIEFQRKASCIKICLREIIADNISVRLCAMFSFIHFNIQNEIVPRPCDSGLAQQQEQNKLENKPVYVSY